MVRKIPVLLIGIIFIAGALRFWQLGTNPPSLTWDEVAWGYNAYTLGIDARDEFGKVLPIQYLESFGDFKPPVYVYLDILPVKIFGLTEFAVRFPSAFFGTLTVLITYFLVKRIFGQRGTTQNPPAGGRNNVEIIALLSALFLAISPWHINLSRAAFEANVATFFIVVGVWLFLGGIAEKRWHLVFSIISFILSMYTFNTARFVGPLLILGLAFAFRKQLLERKRTFALAAVAGILLVTPLAQFILSPQAVLRYQEVNIFSDLSVIEQTNQEIANDSNAFWSRILHNRRLAYGVSYLRHYLDNFNPSFLFIKGDGNPKFSTQDVGQLLVFDLPFLVIGVLFLLRKREGYWWIIPFWLLVGILPAGTARETPHALRIETTLPTFQIIIAYGIYQFVLGIKYYVSSINMRNLLLATCYLLLATNFLYYLHGYYSHYPIEYSGEWQYGYKEAILYVKSIEPQYKRIVFTEALGRPYIYMLFYNKEDPNKFRRTAKIYREAYGFVHIDGYGKYIFTKDVGSIHGYSEAILYIDRPDNLPVNANVLKTITLLNGQPVLAMYTL